MGKRDLYTVDQMNGSAHEYVVTKYSETLSLLEGYRVDRIRGFHCNCLAGQQHKPTCRHREMVEIFTDTDRLNKGALYSYDKKRWDERTVEASTGTGDDIR